MCIIILQINEAYHLELGKDALILVLDESPEADRPAFGTTARSSGYIRHAGKPPKARMIRQVQNSLNT